ncbi:protein of unknown function [Xenorhabdus poinarii G6]|uniref:Uncharacterized protein n=1 Tax=Xenorhabdus poinarii G6 TaxID=1354304 RepID=A0A068R123_9GAMM|nr:protein of unknown function [Xenorhabdus poinarii G6]
MLTMSLDSINIANQHDNLKYESGIPDMLAIFFFIKCFSIDFFVLQQKINLVVV